MLELFANNKCEYKILNLKAVRLEIPEMPRIPDLPLGQHSQARN